MLAKVRPEIEAIPLPEGYELEWWGEVKNSAKAQASLAATFPVFVLMMVQITVALFNSLRQTAVIWLVVPLAIIGVTVGLLTTAQPFGFMALLGFMSLTGMLLKNAIVLVDEINSQRTSGKDDHAAIVDSALSRLRPGDNYSGHAAAHRGCLLRVDGGHGHVRPRFRDRPHDGRGAEPVRDLLQGEVAGTRVVDAGAS